MKKLTLDLDALRVERFEVTQPRPGSRGTVVGADAGATVAPYCMTFTCGDSIVRPCLD